MRSTEASSIEENMPAGSPDHGRGPSARRGLQFTNTTLAELLDTLARTKARMRLVDGLLRSSTTEEHIVDGNRPMTRAELTKLRREMVSLQSDLRAELRRRGDHL